MSTTALLKFSCHVSAMEFVTWNIFSQLFNNPSNKMENFCINLNYFVPFKHL